MGGGKVTNSME